MKSNQVETVSGKGYKNVSILYEKKRKKERNKETLSYFFERSSIHALFQLLLLGFNVLEGGSNHM